jgi:hypothetical protein
MWKLIPKWLRRWVFFAVALPLAAWGLDQLAALIEQRRGPSRTTRWLREPRRLLRSTQAA